MLYVYNDVLAYFYLYGRKRKCVIGAPVQLLGGRLFSMLKTKHFPTPQPVAG